MFFGQKQSLVGLDIGSHSVNVVELEAQSNKQYRLVNWGVSQPLAEAIVDGEIMDRQLVTDSLPDLAGQLDALLHRRVTERDEGADVGGADLRSTRA